MAHLGVEVAILTRLAATMKSFVGTTESSAAGGIRFEFLRPASFKLSFHIARSLLCGSVLEVSLLLH